MDQLFSRQEKDFPAPGVADTEEEEDYTEPRAAHSGAPQDIVGPPPSQKDLPTVTPATEGGEAVVFP